MTRYYHPANGQCVCKIHEAFERDHGITVDQWYEQNPQVTPWWMESCGRCENCPMQVTQQPIQTTTPAQPAKPQTVQTVAAAPQSARKNEEAKPLPVVVQAATPLVKEKPIVHEPVYTEQTYVAPAYHDTTSTADPLVGALLKGMAIALGLGAAALFLLVFGLAIAVAIPITMALIFVWNRRTAIWQAMKRTNQAIDALLMAPFVVIAKTAQAIKARQAPPIQVNTVLMLPGPAPITNPARLLEANYSEPITFTARPVPVAISRKSKKAKVKHGNQ